MMSKRELSAERRELLAALNAAAGPLSPAGLARALGKDREATKKLLYACVKDGQAVTAVGGYTAAPLYQYVTSAGEFAHEGGFSDVNTAQTGTEVTDQSPAVGTDREPVTDATIAAEIASADANVTATMEGGESGVDKPNLVAPPMGLYCHEPPNGHPRGTYPAMWDERGRMVPYYGNGPLPDLSNVG
jgi:hypothetical protein